VLKFVFEYIKLSDITSDYVKLIYQKIHESFQESKGDYKKPDVNDLLNKAESDEFRSFLTNIALSKYEVSQFWNEKRTSGDEDEVEELWKAVDDVLTKFYLRKIQKIEFDLTEKIKEAEKSGDEGRLLELLVKKSEIGKKKNILGIKGFKDIIRKYLNSLNKV